MKTGADCCLSPRAAGLSGKNIRAARPLGYLSPRAGRGRIALAMRSIANAIRVRGRLTKQRGIYYFGQR
jgi:hypothetical protein